MCLTVASGLGVTLLAEGNAAIYHRDDVTCRPSEWTVAGGTGGGVADGRRPPGDLGVRGVLRTVPVRHRLTAR